MYYKSDKGFFVFVDGASTTVFVENDAEGFYRRYQEWLAEGNTPEPWGDQ